MRRVRNVIAAVATLVAGSVGVLAAGGIASAEAARCTRLPLSDIAFGEKETIAQALGKLDAYSKSVAAKRGWPAEHLVRSNDVSRCEVFLNLGPFGTEYKCLVTATYCVAP